MSRDVFIDESSQTKHRYLLLGGIITRCPEYEMERLLTEARGIDLPYGELGWVKVSRSKLSAYTRFIDAFFDQLPDSRADFHSLVIDTHRLDDKTYNGGSRSAGFDKELYQLLMKFGRLYRDATFNVYLDQRSTPAPLTELRTIINRGMMKLSPPRSWPVRRLHFRNSSQCQSLQVVDLLLGALGFHLNGHRRKAEAGPAKCELSDYILDRAGIVDPMRDTSLSGRFTVWHRQLKAPIRTR